MKRFYTVIIFIFLLFIINFEGKTEELKWYSFDKGIERAQKLKRPILVNFFADWCHWCRVMAQTTFNTPSVIRKLNTSYIPIKIDVGKNEVLTYRGVRYTPTGFAHAIGVEGLPTVLFLDKNGTIITKLGGYIRPSTFSALLDYINEECYLDQIAFEDYFRGKKNCRGTVKK